MPLCYAEASPMPLCYAEAPPMPLCYAEAIPMPLQIAEASSMPGSLVDEARAYSVPLVPLFSPSAPRTSQTGPEWQRGGKEHHGGDGRRAEGRCRVPVRIARSRRDDGAWMRGWPLYAGFGGYMFEVQEKKVSWGSGALDGAGGRSAQARGLHVTFRLATTAGPGGERWGRLGSECRHGTSSKQHSHTRYANHGRPRSAARDGRKARKNVAP